MAAQAQPFQHDEFIPQLLESPHTRLRERSLHQRDAVGNSVRAQFGHAMGLPRKAWVVRRGATWLFGRRGVALSTVLLAFFAPVKHLDWRVNPIRYERMSLVELCAALRKDHRVQAMAPYPDSTNIFVTFHTDRSMSRRQVLEQLAAAAGCDLKIGYCAEGGSILFGSHPSFTRLVLKKPGPKQHASPVRGADAR